MNTQSLNTRPDNNIENILKPGTLSSSAKGFSGFSDIFLSVHPESNTKNMNFKNDRVVAERKSLNESRRIQDNREKKNQERLQQKQFLADRKLKQQKIDDQQIKIQQVKDRQISDRQESDRRVSLMRELLETERLSAESIMDKNASDKDMVNKVLSSQDATVMEGELINNSSVLSEDFFHEIMVDGQTSNSSLAAGPAISQSFNTMNESGFLSPAVENKLLPLDFEKDLDNKLGLAGITSGSATLSIFFTSNDGMSAGLNSVEESKTLQFQRTDIIGERLSGSATARNESDVTQQALSQIQLKEGEVNADASLLKQFSRNGKQADMSGELSASLSESLPAEKLLLSSRGTEIKAQMAQLLKDGAEPLSNKLFNQTLSDTGVVRDAQMLNQRLDRLGLGKAETSVNVLENLSSNLMEALTAADNKSQSSQNTLLSVASAPNPITAAMVRAGQGLFSAAMPNPPLQTMQPSWGQAVGERVLMMAAKNLSAANIQLDPPELGQLQVRIVMNQEQASITFITPQQSVRELLDESVQRLREQFEQKGINLIDVDISGGAGSREGGSLASEKETASNSSVPNNKQIMDETEGRASNNAIVLDLSAPQVDYYV